MKIAYLIDCESLGGGCEYIWRKSVERQAKNDECRTFYSKKGECRAAMIDAWGADEIHVNHLKALLQLLGRPWARPRGKVRFVVHGIHLRKYPWMIRELAAKGLAAFPRWVVLWSCYQTRRILEAWLYRRCDEIVALTESDRVDILRWYGRKLKVVVEPNTLEGWVPQLTEGFPSDLTESFKYVFVGRFSYQKGQDRWIRYLAAQSAMLDPQHPTPKARTLFIGDGEAFEFCQKLADDLGVAEQCVFVGAIPNAERLLKCADIVVSASRWEGMPYLIMKARALGCRILATDCPGNRDVLAGYEKWEIFEPG